jgi:hypothetical protein
MQLFLDITRDGDVEKRYIDPTRGSFCDRFGTMRLRKLSAFAA